MGMDARAGDLAKGLQHEGAEGAGGATPRLSARLVSHWLARQGSANAHADFVGVSRSMGADAADCGGSVVVSEGATQSAESSGSTAVPMRPSNEDADPTGTETLPAPGVAMTLGQCTRHTPRDEQRPQWCAPPECRSLGSEGRQSTEAWQPCACAGGCGSAHAERRCTACCSADGEQTRTRLETELRDQLQQAMDHLADSKELAARASVHTAKLWDENEALRLELRELLGQHREALAKSNATLVCADSDAVSALSPESFGRRDGSPDGDAISNATVEFGVLPDEESAEQGSPLYYRIGDGTDAGTEKEDMEENQNKQQRHQHLAVGARGQAESGQPGVSAKRRPRHVVSGGMVSRQPPTSPKPRRFLQRGTARSSSPRQEQRARQCQGALRRSRSTESVGDDQVRTRSAQSEGRQPEPRRVRYTRRQPARVLAGWDQPRKSVLARLSEAAAVPATSDANASPTEPSMDASASCSDVALQASAGEGGEGRPADERFVVLRQVAEREAPGSPARGRAPAMGRSRSGDLIASPTTASAIRARSPGSAAAASLWASSLVERWQPQQPWTSADGHGPSGCSAVPCSPASFSWRMPRTPPLGPSQNPQEFVARQLPVAHSAALLHGVEKQLVPCMPRFGPISMAQSPRRTPPSMAGAMTQVSAASIQMPPRALGSLVPLAQLGAPCAPQRFLPTTVARPQSPVSANLRAKLVRL
mmetsp:Transcript_123503/g.357107  ORF Transcript_123503/g.357107 Transcript_123503/m.357107 type:complete len:708 (-) Transcript_123503:100-2223(-)